MLIDCVRESCARFAIFHLVMRASSYAQASLAYQRYMVSLSRNKVDEPPEPEPST
jgi:hypothetical protein